MSELDNVSECEYTYHVHLKWYEERVGRDDREIIEDAMDWFGPEFVEVEPHAEDWVKCRARYTHGWHACSVQDTITILALIPPQAAVLAITVVRRY